MLLLSMGWGAGCLHLECARLSLLLDAACDPQARSPVLPAPRDEDNLPHRWWRCGGKTCRRSTRRRRRAWRTRGSTPTCSPAWTWRCRRSSCRCEPEPRHGIGTVSSIEPAGQTLCDLFLLFVVHAASCANCSQSSKKPSTASSNAAVIALTMVACWAAGKAAIGNDPSSRVPGA